MKLILINKKNLFDGILIFFVVSGLLFNTMVGALSALVFLVCGGWFLFKFRHICIDVVLKNWILFSIPLLALVSVLWSVTPIITLRGSIQLLLTTVIATIIAVQVDYKVLIKASSLAFFSAMLISYFSDRYALNGMTGEYNLIGIFGSKNYLSMNTAISLFVGVSLFFSEKKSIFFKILGFFLALISLLVLFKTNSLGSALTVTASMMASMLIVFVFGLKLSDLTKSIISWAGVVAFLLIVFSIVYVFSSGGFEDAMYSIGKDPTLTGRTFIWDRGFDLINKSPILGSGFQSVFYIGNPFAEEIWEYAHIPSGSGFNFHNSYIDIAVEFGIVGVLLFLLLLINFLGGITKLRKKEIYSKDILAMLIFIYMFTQTFLEAGWFSQFSVSQFYLCVAFIYLMPSIGYKKNYFGERQ